MTLHSINLMLKEIHIKISTKSIFPHTYKMTTENSVLNVKRINMK